MGQGTKILACSSEVEPTTVNRLVAGSNPAMPAKLNRIERNGQTQIFDQERTVLMRFIQLCTPSLYGVAGSASVS